MCANRASTEGAKGGKERENLEGRRKAETTTPRHTAGAGATQGTWDLPTLGTHRTLARLIPHLFFFPLLR